MVSDCIFCKIVAGDIPASKVYEDEHFLAFLDISQVTAGHTLVIPKKHARNLLEMTPNETGELFEVVSQVAKNVENGNGRFCRNLVEMAVLNFALRNYGGDEVEADIEYILKREDFCDVTVFEEKKSTIGFQVFAS